LTHRRGFGRRSAGEEVVMASSLRRVVEDFQCSRPGGVASVERWFRVLGNVDAAALHFVCHDRERCGENDERG